MPGCKNAHHTLRGTSMHAGTYTCQYIYMPIHIHEQHMLNAGKCIYMPIHAHSNTYTCQCIYMPIHIHEPHTLRRTCMHAYTYTCQYIDMHITRSDAHACMQIHIHAEIQVFECTHTHTHILSHMHTHKHAEFKLCMHCSSSYILGLFQSMCLRNLHKLHRRMHVICVAYVIVIVIAYSHSGNY